MSHLTPRTSTTHLWRRRTAVTALFSLVLAAVGAAVAAPAHAVTIDTNAWYTIVSRHSGKAIDLYNFSTADAAPIVQWARNDGYQQQWQFVGAGSGYYKLKSRHSGKFLELPNANDGTGLVQNPDNGSTRQHFAVRDTDSGYVKFLNRHSGKALDLWEWSTTDGGIISQFADLGGWNQNWQLINTGSGGGGGGGSQTGLVGWATQGGGTTGGGSASATTVTSSSALASAVSGTTARVVRISGTISCSGMITVGSNKTILGNSGATIAGCGLNVSNASNVIIRNIAFRDWDDDGINVQYSTRVWIDHNSFSNGYDGAVDVKRASDYVTISWNRVFNHDKSMLLGHSDDNAGEDAGHLRVTYHHNWFDGSNQRHPRVRFGNPVHVYNNYYNGNGGYGVASTCGAGVLVEGNYFENVDDTYHRGEGSSPVGGLVARNNYFVGSSAGGTGGSVASIPYSYTLDSASGVKASVTAGAGAGRITV
ncbi:pectate lyase [Allocatelliglobosispora scoriae]|uniref:Pectate lyase n=1 Tax=Allocatelliglobosispora scoriae TaxID=643052 RepID=A0A841C444_9ACTN|nr:RICIN domain-containing protein [Allocatelliglobosispora scoriae]MBB5873601.1 pectate lyase [Allocatelliglobosispora scoriae]